MLSNRNILLGVTGSIAAYKSIDLARRLMDEGADVKVVMTDAASRFITPYVMEVITGHPVHNDLFHDSFAHIELSKDAHLFIIAPATANTINKLSCGIADDMLSTLWLAYEGPALIAPAMNSRMWRNAIVQKNVRTLRKIGINFVGPVPGSLACGEEGEGRMADISSLIEAAVSLLTYKDLKGQKILVTAGPTREAIDSVRYLSNRSSGKMGYAIAGAAARRGADVTLISGPSSESRPEGVSFINVESASEMSKAVESNLSRSHALIMAAAVSDFVPSDKTHVKLKKNDINILKLKKSKDILKKAGSIKKQTVLVGFAAETSRDIESARMKLKEKNLDLIVLNDLSRKGAGFDVETNIVTLIDRNGDIRDYPLMKKTEVANLILDKIVEIRPGKKK